MTDARYITDEPSGEERFELYRLCPCSICDGTGKVSDYPGDLDVRTIRCSSCRGEGRTHELIATATDPQSVGVALVTLAREGEWEGCPLGILDTQGATGEKWLIKPWLPSARNISDAGRTLAKARKGK